MIGKIRRFLRGQEDPLASSAGQFWDQQIQKRSVYWAEHPLVRAYVNECITGVDWIWPLVALKAGWAYKPLALALSIGCGGGNLERALRTLNVVTKITGLDVSKQSIKTARAQARAEHLNGIRYRVADCNRLTLPRERYDAVFFHASLHHIADPDALLRQVRMALKPHGLLYIDDYVGPSRDEWTETHLQHAREAWASLPQELRIQPVNPPFDWTDPSEMIRPSRTLPAFYENFEVLHDRPYWGNLLFPLWCALDGEALLKPERQPLVESLIAAERTLVSERAFEKPLFAVLLGRRKP